MRVAVDYKIATLKVRAVGCGMDSGWMERQNGKVIFFSELCYSGFLYRVGINFFQNFLPRIFHSLDRVIDIYGDSEYYEGMRKHTEDSMMAD